MRINLIKQKELRHQRINMQGGTRKASASDNRVTGFTAEGSADLPARGTCLGVGGGFRRYPAEALRVRLSAGLLVRVRSQLRALNTVSLATMRCSRAYLPGKSISTMPSSMDRMP